MPQMLNGLFPSLFPIDCEKRELWSRCVISVCSFMEKPGLKKRKWVVLSCQIHITSHCFIVLSPPLRLFELPKWQLRQAVLNWYSSCHLPCKQSPVRR